MCSLMHSLLGGSLESNYNLVNGLSLGHSHKRIKVTVIVIHYTSLRAPGDLAENGMEQQVQLPLPRG